ncbi:MAG: riboflavin synthase, partial [Candidatus Margulisiibacteriota bacterium]
MFTGIIEEIGIIKNIIQKPNLKRITVKSKNVKNGLKVGASVCVSGVCLTVVETKWDYFTVEAVEHTYKSTTLKQLKIGDSVNLEAALSATGRFDGHLVSGHVDTVAVIARMKQVGEQHEIFIRIPADCLANVVSRGSICIEGISLTIAGVRQNVIKVVVIPHTFQNTTLSRKQVNHFVNIEFDIIGKYALQRIGQLVAPEHGHLEAKFLE